jgi:ADP-ribosylglycohydrolase
MLVEMAVGDAYGAGFEFAPLDLIRQFNTGTSYVQHPRHPIPPGRYTDDTQMSLAVAEALISGLPWTPARLADKFVEVFRRDPRPGYSRRFYPFLQESATGAEFLARVNPVNDTSGAAMRAPPLGVLPTLDRVKEFAGAQAAVTHNTPAGIHAAQASALTAHYFLYGLGPREKLGSFLESLVPGTWAKPWRGEVGTKGWMCVRAAVTALMRNDCLSALLRDCVAFSGDVDTVAAIALAAASVSAEYEQDLPRELLAGLENGAYGRDYLAGLDRQLLALKAGTV